MRPTRHGSRASHSSLLRIGWSVRNQNLAFIGVREMTTKKISLVQILLDDAAYVQRSDVTVERNVTGSTVAFDHGGETFCFLQGDEADVFNDECERTYNHVQTMGMDIVEMALARVYVEAFLEG